MASSINLKNSGGSTLAITHSDSKGGKTIIGTDIVTSVATINDFPTVGIQDGDTVIVKEEGRGGTFILKTGALSDPNNGTIFASSDVTKHWYRQYEGAVNVKWFGGSQNASFFGDGATTTRSSDSVVTVNRAVDDTVTGNGHCFSDSSDVDRGGDISYASFDARHTISGTNSYGHFAPFQNGIVHGTSGSTGIMYGYVDVPQITSGTVNARYGAYIADVYKTGGTLNASYGLYIPEQTAGTTNWAVVTKGATKSLFEGALLSQGGVYSGSISGDWGIDKSASAGMRLKAGIGTTYDFSILTNDLATFIMTNNTGTNDVRFWGDVGVTGSLSTDGAITSATGIQLNGSLSGNGSISFNPSAGIMIRPNTGTTYDFSVMNVGSSLYSMAMPTGTNDIKFFGKTGFNGATPLSKPTVSGSRGGNAALASLITALASYGLVTDSTTV